MSKQESFRFVKYLWQDEEADKLAGVDRLVYRSNRLGDDLTLTNTGGGAVTGLSATAFVGPGSGLVELIAGPAVPP
ncbi:MAG: hypothetical protein ACRD9Y_28880, partial [Blastocatellia bacterium]